MSNCFASCPMYMRGSNKFGLIFRFLKWFCPDHLYEEIEGDLIQRFNHDLKSPGYADSDDRLTRAKRRLIWNTLLFFRPGIIFRNKFTFRTNRLFIVQSYCKTTYRHLLKSKVNFALKLGGLVL